MTLMNLNKYNLKDNIMNKLIENLKQGIKFAEAHRENLDSVDWEFREGLLISCNQAKEIIALKNWKDEAIQVFADLNLQEIGKEIPVPLGESIAKNILPFIKKIKAYADLGGGSGYTNLPQQLIKAGMGIGNIEKGSVTNVEIK